MGRWHSVDPIDEFHSPYLALGNNPIIFVDPDGMDIAYYDAEGIHLFTEECDPSYTFVWTGETWDVLPWSVHEVRQTPPQVLATDKYFENFARFGPFAPKYLDEKNKPVFDGIKYRNSFANSTEANLSALEGDSRIAVYMVPVAGTKFYASEHRPDATQGEALGGSFFISRCNNAYILIKVELSPAGNVIQNMWIEIPKDNLIKWRDRPGFVPIIDAFKYIDKYW